MKAHLVIGTLVLSAGLLSACAQSGKTPSLPGHTPNTSAVPAPDRYQHNSAIDSSTMVAPTR